MTAEIVTFPRAVTPATRKLVRKIVREEIQAAETPLTTTAKNQRLRRERWEVWRRADALTEYWLRRLRFMDAIKIADRWGFSDKTLQRQNMSYEARWRVLESYREAKRKQILTPAPDAAAVNWKRARLRDPIELGLIDLTKERVEQVIAADMAFLSTHPARRPRSIQQA
jgi:hypothetical protein